MSHRVQDRAGHHQCCRLLRVSAEVGKGSLTPRRQAHRHQDVLVVGWEQGLPMSLYSSKEGDWKSSGGHLSMFTEGQHSVEDVAVCLGKAQGKRSHI